MRPSPPIDDRSDERHSGRLSAGSAHARIAVLDSPAVARQSCRATPTTLVHTDAHPYAWQKPDHRNRSAPVFSSPSPRQNPHSPRCTVGAPPPAISCLGAFRTPAVGARR